MNEALYCINRALPIHVQGWHTTRPADLFEGTYTSMEPYIPSIKPFFHTHVKGWHNTCSVDTNISIETYIPSKKLYIPTHVEGMA